MLGHTPVDFNWKIFCNKGTFNFVWHVNIKGPFEAKTNPPRQKLGYGPVKNVFLRLACNCNLRPLATTCRSVWPGLNREKAMWRSCFFFQSFRQIENKLKRQQINNGEWPEWSAVWAEIIGVISKLNERAARVRFQTRSPCFRPKLHDRSSITTLLDPFWNRTCNLTAYARTTRFLLVPVFIEASYQTMTFLSYIFVQCDWLV